LARGGRLYEEALGEKHVYSGELLQRFEKLLNQQDLEEVGATIIEITKIFDAIEMDLPLH
jgi:hypothetical protein